MAEKVEAKKSPKSRSLTATLAIAFVALSLVVLLVASSLQLYAYFLAQQTVVTGEQRLIAQQAANEVQSFIQERFGELEAAVKFGELSNVSAVELEQNLEKLLGLEPAFRQLVLVDAEEQVLARASRLSQAAGGEVTDRLEAELLAQTEQGERYIGPAYIDEVTFEPLIVMAVPVQDIFGDYQGSLVAEVNLKFMWDLVDRLEIGRTGVAYVVDRQGNLLAFGDVTRVLAGENLSHLAEVAEFVERKDALDELEEESTPISTGINGTNVLATHVPLGSPDWAVVTELPVIEAYTDVIRNIVASGAIILIVAVLAGFVGVYLARRLAAPLLNLTETSGRIASGEIELQATAEGPTEVAQLAEAFNRMTAQLREFIDSLEQRVTDRTQRLEMVAILSEHLSAILDLDQLLAELVKEVKERFGYYHAHIYLIDGQRQNLVMAAGVGEAGAQMKAQGHQIPLDAATSLVARAARSGEIVWVDNVRVADDWLPNPLLPDTYSEMAVPVILEGQVVGMLDVQEDRVAGLDEGDANLLRSLANQVAVTIRNARLFAEVEDALAESRATQKRYLAQSWQQTKIASPGGQYHYARTDAPALSEAAVIQARQAALTQDDPAVVALGSNGTDEPGDTAVESIVAPVKLQDMPIGTLQLHPLDADRNWSEDDLAVVEAVVDELAQAAESLRLFEETRERASYEQLVGEITAKLRQAPSLDVLAKTAAEELGRVLGVSHSLVKVGVTPPPEHTAGNGEQG